jgi:hypothetical protein
MTYEQRINELIPLAEKEANKALADKKRYEDRQGKSREGNNGATYVHCLWFEEFHKVINRMAFDCGLRKWC